MNPIFQSLYGTDDVSAIIKSKHDDKQVRALVGVSMATPMSADECRAMCKACNNLTYVDGYEKRVRTYTITEESADRYGDIVRSAGLDTTNYEKNPVVQFAHDYSQLPIGNALKIVKLPGATKAITLFFGNEVDPSGRSDLIFRFVNANAMNACSIGFQPREANRPDTLEERAAIGLGEMGVEYVSSELLEFSPTPVPANPNCLQDSYQRSFVKSLAGIFTPADVAILRKEPLFSNAILDAFLQLDKKAFVFIPKCAACGSGDNTWDGTFTMSMKHAIGTPDDDGQLDVVEGIHGDDKEPALVFSYKGKSGSCGFKTVQNSEGTEWGVWTNGMKKSTHTDISEVPMACKSLMSELLVGEEPRTMPDTLVVSKTEITRMARLKQIEVKSDADDDPADLLPNIEGNFDENNFVLMNLGKLVNGGVVKIVCGKYVRDNFNARFIGGGHWLVYPFIPKGEIWVELLLDAQDTQLNAYHECGENLLMDLGGLAYDKAHDAIDSAESACRMLNHDSVDYSALLTDIQMLMSKCFPSISVIAKGVIPYAEHSKDDAGATWDASAEKAKATPTDLKVMCAWYDSAKPDVKSSYKLPHHRASGYHTVWNGVKAAMGAILGARGGVDIPGGDLRGCYSHLSKHYAEFSKDVPDFKDYSDTELKSMFPENYPEESQFADIRKLIEGMSENLSAVKHVAEKASEDANAALTAASDAVSKRLYDRNLRINFKKSAE